MAWAVNRPAAGTAYSLPSRLFPATNWWNLRVDAAPLDPGSSAYITYNDGIGVPGVGYADWCRFRTDWGNNYGLPYCTVSGDHPKVEFQGANYASSTDFVPYPIPVEALTEAGWTEDLAGTINSPTWLNASDSFKDRHLLIFDKDNEILYEIYQPFHNASASPVTVVVDPGGGAPLLYPYGSTVIQPGAFYCASACYWDAKTNNARQAGLTSSDAAGLQVLPGLVSYDEIISGNPITHAHRFTLFGNTSDTPKYVWPATHDAGSYNAGQVPLGARFRLKASYNTSGEYAVCQTFLQALKDYGLIFADNASGYAQITGTNDARWGTSEQYPRVQLIDTISRFRMTDFEVIQLGWNPVVPQSKTPVPGHVPAAQILL